MTDLDSVGVPAIDQDAQDEEKCPRCGRKKHDKKYRRSSSQRKKALKRDAADPDSDLDDAAREFIEEHNGDLVPEGYEVSHEEPLYTVAHDERCELDVEENMATQPKDKHRQRHKRSGQQYHDFPKPKKKKK